MRRFGIVLLGALLLLPVGCGGKTEEKSDEKTGNNGADAKANGSGTDRKMTDATSSEKTSTPEGTAKLPDELAALSYAPGDTFALFSARPSAVIDKPLLKSLGPLRMGVDQALAMARKGSGINPGDVERVTLALWMGEGHAFPGSNSSATKAESKVIEEPEIRTEPDISSPPPDVNGFDEPETKVEEVKSPEIKELEIPEPPPRAGEEKSPDDRECGLQPGDEFEEEIQEEPGHGGPGGPDVFGMRMDAVIIFQFNKPFDEKGFEAANRGEFEDAKHKDVTYRANFDTAYYQPNPQTLILCPRGDMPMALDSKTPAKLVQSALQRGLDHDVAVLADLKPLRNLLQGPAMMGEGAVPGTADLPGQLESVYAHLDVEEGVKLNLSIDANSEEAPKTIKNAFDQGYGMAGQFIAFQLPEELNREFGEDLGTDLAKLAHTIYAGTKGEANGKQFQLSLEVPGSVTNLLPKLMKRQQEVAKAMVGKNNMKQIGLAIHNYHETFSQFPFPNGNSNLPKAEQNKLSWRVHILPTIGEYELYEQFKLDEAWDSAHNKKLLAKMPDVYQLSEGVKEGHTQFVLPAGKGFFGENPGRGLRFRDVTDGASNTLMSVTVVPEKAVPWTKPGGFELDLKQAAKILGGHDDGFLALFADGRVQSLNPKIEVDTLKALLTISGAEIVDYSDFETGRGRRR